jgi:ATP-dependent Lhr-like helicase
MLQAVRGEAPPDAPPAGVAATTLDALTRRGALFPADLLLATGLVREELAGGLWDLVGRGLVTGDGFQPLRDLMASGRASQRRGHAVQGRWSLVARVESERLASDDLADRVAGQLLARYGVVFRELSARESFTVPWRDVVRALRRREARGLARGGRFVSGFLGEQYALPEAVDALRRVRRAARTGELVRVRACDPLNVVGILLPGPRVPSHSGVWVTYQDGAQVATEAQSASGSAA